jgi:hypothetical protein
MSFTTEQINKVLEYHTITHADARKASETFYNDFKITISPYTVRTYWRKNGLKVNPKGGVRYALNGGRGTLTDEEIKEVVAAYETYNGRPTIARKAIVNDKGKPKYSTATFQKYWEKYCLGKTEQVKTDQANSDLNPGDLEKKTEQ